MFTKDTLIKLLKELTGAQESIEKVSIWLQQYKDEAPSVVQVWKNFFFEATNEKKLTLLYLVNDVVQHSKRKGPQFVDAFGHVLPKCMAECRDHGAKNQIERMLDIWESREIFHKHVVHAMKFNLDKIGMDDSFVKLTDLLESLDNLRTLENRSSEVLTMLSQRLDTTDFANAFNVTSRKEGDKYAGDFDETATFLEQYCSCLSKQTTRRTEMLRKINSTLFQMEKQEESVKNLEKDSKGKQTQLVRTRKAITSRLMLIEEGMVNFGDDSPDREEIENLTSEEEDVDVEGIETIEAETSCAARQRTDKGVEEYVLKAFIKISRQVHKTQIFQNVFKSYARDDNCVPSTVLWLCLNYVFIRWFLILLLKIKSATKLMSAPTKPAKLHPIIRDSYILSLAASQSSSPCQVFMLTDVSKQSDHKFGPRLPQGSGNNQFGPKLPPSTPGLHYPRPPPPPPPIRQIPQKKFGPAIPGQVNLPTVEIPMLYGPSLPSNPDSSYGTSIPPTYGIPIPNKSDEDSKKVTGFSFRVDRPKSPEKSSHKTGDTENKLPDIPPNCLTTIERIFLLYDLDPESDTELDRRTNLQQVFGGVEHGYDPDEAEKNDCDSPPKRKKDSNYDVSATATNPQSVTFSNTFGLHQFEPPIFKSFPVSQVDAVIQGKQDSQKKDGRSSSHSDSRSEPSHRSSHSSRSSSRPSRSSRSDSSHRKSDSIPLPHRFPHPPSQIPPFMPPMNMLPMMNFGPNMPPQNMNNGPNMPPPGINHGPNMQPQGMNHGPNMPPPGMNHGPNMHHQGSMNHGPNMPTQNMNEGPNRPPQNMNQGPNMPPQNMNQGPNMPPQNMNQGPNMPPQGMNQGPNMPPHMNHGPNLPPVLNMNRPPGPNMQFRPNGPPGFGNNQQQHNMFPGEQLMPPGVEPRFCPPNGNFNMRAQKMPPMGTQFGNGQFNNDQRMPARFRPPMRKHSSQSR